MESDTKLNVVKYGTVSFSGEIVEMRYERCEKDLKIVDS